MHVHRLFGSRQCRVCGAHNEQGAWPHRRDVRVRCRNLLLRLLYIRGAIQLDSGKGRRAAMDCQDHDLLGRYLTYWFTADERARWLGLYLTGNPLALVIGGPISGFILDTLNGSVGLSGWQWLFIVEGVPSVLLGFGQF